MAIRTIAIIHGHYIALQGYWLWEELLRFTFIDLSTRTWQPDTSTPDPTLSAVLLRHHHIPTPALLSTDRYIADICMGEMAFVDQAIAGAGTAEAVTLDDTEDDQELSSLESSLCSMDFDPPLRISSSQDVCGLGISGLLSKDGSGPFTGLGAISVRPFAWRHTPTPGNSEPRYADTPVGANTYRSACQRREPYMDVSTTLAVRTRILESIVDCDPALTDAPHTTETTPTQPPARVTPIDQSHRLIRFPPPPMKHFAAPTISSELRRMSNLRSSIGYPSHRPYHHRLSRSSVVILGTPRFLRNAETRDEIASIRTPLRSWDTTSTRFAKATSGHHRSRAFSVDVTVASPSGLNTIPRWR
ncbi:hypothetical protein D9756_001128 [Leucocoprinus leucothites]|uniref:Uncharacterized protein n=1 Tax=Leucocoprinus leucothites TaxID=201217 RepID=A0A8H5LNK0_9AGAR|nr:hypothetical protein D9756_001128 [Leucoagaricus leucothites]